MTHPGHSLELTSGDYRRFVGKLNVGVVAKRVTALRNHSTGQNAGFSEIGDTVNGLNVETNHFYLLSSC